MPVAPTSQRSTWGIHLADGGGLPTRPGSPCALGVGGPPRQIADGGGPVRGTLRVVPRGFFG